MAYKDLAILLGSCGREGPAVSFWKGPARTSALALLGGKEHGAWEFLLEQELSSAPASLLSHLLPPSTSHLPPGR